MLDKANAVQAALETCKSAVVSCEKALVLERERKAGKPSAFLTGLKWAGVGAAIVGAFFLGTQVN